ncbi:DUF4267 domain-containing protein [Paractinoplanes brasiliensis]|uniref:Uncharacterized protein DUF4267 n=1 Tax=Paractinoplanes brasiliensis TaxID=52695 RepID=A0A4R6JDZ6_9ACTN|nr:DUF4267 domain-containing protein [Actinoplanes brasiliensis]TDO32765.1 uncharacterized protein DUF4267 [Actinoplanes brasiliensis]GID31692.1 membrane protein [Actinoplanes brasiliensis]
MLAVLAYGLAIVINLFIIFIGIRFLLSPEVAATGYGVSSPAGAYLSVKGVRDLTYGLVGLAVLFGGGVLAEAWFMLVVALVPLGDMLIVLRNGGTRAVAYGIHFATAVIILISAALLFVEAAQ